MAQDFSNKNLRKIINDYNILQRRYKHLLVERNINVPKLPLKSRDLRYIIDNYFWLKNRVKATSGALAPDPENLVAVLMTKCDIDLSWEAPETSGLGFRIERSLTGLFGSWTLLANVSGTTFNYSDTPPSANTTYYYRVLDYGGMVEGYSNIANATIPVDPGVGIPIDTGEITLSIELTDVDESTLTVGFSSFDSDWEVWRSDNGGTFTLIDTISSGVSEYIDEGLDEGLKEYQIKKVDWTCFSQIESVTVTLPLFQDDGIEIYSVFQFVTIEDNRAGANAFNVRRSSDDAVTTILWQDYIGQSITLDSPVLAGGTLGDWVGANDAFISGWYRQGANLSYVANQSLNQAATSAQPKIISAGVLITKNGVIAPTFDGTDTVSGSLATDSLFPSEDLVFTIIGSNDVTNTAGNSCDFSGGNVFYLSRDFGSNPKLGFKSSSGGDNLAHMSVNRTVADSLILSIFKDEDSGINTLYDNGQTGETTDSFSSGSGLVLGRQSGSNFLTGTIQHFQGVNETNSVNRVAMETKLTALLGLTYPN